MDELQLSQDSLFSVGAASSHVEQPVTPEPPHASLPDGPTAAVAKLQAERVDNATHHMTPPPSSQVPSSQRAKTRTPTPTVSHISTPPPTIEMPAQANPDRLAARFTGGMSAQQIATAPIEGLRKAVKELQAELQDAKMAAAHHNLQHQMLVQEHAATVDRMAVEARITQYENEFIHVAQQARAAATPVQPSPFLEGTIPVQKDLYQRMCREIQQLTRERDYLVEDQAHSEKTIMRQDLEIASLSDKVYLMRERIRENRDSMSRHRRPSISSRMDATPRSMYNDPLRHGVSSQEQPQPFAALLQASEMASQEARRPSASKKGHMRNTHSLSSLPNTPSYSRKQQQPLYHTPYNRHTQAKVPSTAPLPRISAMRTPDIYTQPILPVQGPPSDGTVSAPEDDDSEAETDIIEPDEVPLSQASQAASFMLRNSQEQQAMRTSFTPRGTLPTQQPSANKMKQTKLFGQVKKPNVERESERPAKRARTGQAVGLGIS